MGRKIKTMAKSTATIHLQTLCIENLTKKFPDQIYFHILNNDQKLMTKSKLVKIKEAEMTLQLLMSFETEMTEFTISMLSSKLLTKDKLLASFSKIRFDSSSDQPNEFSVEHDEIEDTK